MNLKQSSFHEAAHVVADFLLCMGLKRVSVAHEENPLPKGEVSGCSGRCKLAKPLNEFDLLPKIISTMAGQFGYQLTDGLVDLKVLKTHESIDAGAGQDNNDTLGWCEEHVRRIEGWDWGTPEPEGVSRTKSDEELAADYAVQRRAVAMQKALFEYTRIFLTPHRETIRALAEVLFAQPDVETTTHDYGHHRLLTIRELDGKLVKTFLESRGLRLCQELAPLYEIVIPKAPDHQPKDEGDMD